MVIFAVLKLPFTTFRTSCGTTRIADKYSNPSKILSHLVITLTEVDQLEADEGSNLAITVLLAKSFGAE